MLTRLSVGILGAFAIASAVAGESYPSKPITIVVPLAAGGPTDVLTRLVGDHMSRTLAKPGSIP
jgi:tripartite-type tricarboxylate transporter receptor subunit TctC